MGKYNSTCCATPVALRVFLHELTAGSMTLDDIIAVSGATAIKSIAVSQLSGDSSVTTDSGSGRVISAGQNYSWGTSGVTPDSSFVGSLWSITAVGTASITVTYRI